MTGIGRTSSLAPGSGGPQPSGPGALLLEWPCGQTASVGRVRGEAEAALAAPARYRRMTLDRGPQRVGATVGVDDASLAGGGPAVPFSRAPEGVVYLWTTVLGRPGRPLAAGLGVRPQSVSAAAARSRAASQRWDSLVQKLLELSPQQPTLSLGVCGRDAARVFGGAVFGGA